MDVYGAHTAIKPGLAEKLRENMAKKAGLTQVLHSLVRAGKTARQAAKSEGGPTWDQSPDRNLEQSAR